MKPSQTYRTGAGILGVTGSLCLIVGGILSFVSATEASEAYADRQDAYARQCVENTQETLETCRWLHAQGDPMPMSGIWATDWLAAGLILLSGNGHLKWLEARAARKEPQGEWDARVYMRRWGT